MFRYFIRLSYLGTNYFGWQIQPNEISVQEKLNYTLSTLLKSEIDLTGCGRTDTGVHAQNFIAHFDCIQLFSKEELFQLAYKMNSFLPNDIAIHEIFQVNDDAHARFDAITRTYTYTINSTKNPFGLSTSWYRYGNLDLQNMNKAAERLLHHSDFTCFSKTHTQTKTNNCKIMKAEWREESNGILIFTITADRFLRNMVRAIVGTLVNIGSGKNEWNEIDQIILSKNRSEAGQSVPAHGLKLVEITYKKEITDKIS